MLDGVNEIAIKLLKPEDQNNPARVGKSTMTKFVSEMNVLRACRDAHIVSFQGAWVHPVCL